MIITSAKPTDALTRPQEIHADALRIGKEHLLSVLKKWFEQEVAFVRSTEEQAVNFFQEISQAASSHEQVRIGKMYSQSLCDTIAQRYAAPEPRSFDQLFPKYRSAWYEYLRGLPKSVIRRQPEERFVSLSGEGWVIRLTKNGKRHSRHLSYWPTQTQNQWRKWRKKPAISLPAWRYKVPLRGLTRYYYLEKPILALRPLVEEAYQRIAESSRMVWKAQDRLYKIAHEQMIVEDEDQSLDPWDTYRSDFDQALGKLEEFSASLEMTFDRVFAEQFAQFEQDFDRAGTIELPASRFRTSRLKALSAQYNRAFQKETLGWRTTLFALHDDWRLDEELNLLNDTLWLAYFDWVEQLRTGLQDQILSEADRMFVIIQESSERIEATESEEMKRSLRQERKAIDQQLIRECIPAITNLIHQQSFSTSLNQLRDVSVESLEQIADHRGLVGSDAYDTPLSQSDISYVSPRQLANYEMLPRFVTVLGDIQQQTRQMVSEVQKLVQEVGQISYFNLDSAIAVYERESTTPEEAQQIALEGLKRGLTHAKRLHEQLQELLDYQMAAVHPAVREFEEQLTGLTNNHYALELKFRLARALAAEKTKELQHRTFRYTRRAVPRFLRYLSRQYQEGNQRIGLYRRRIAMETSSEVTTEISDFLAQTEVAINRLPYVYQRLFSIKPLEDAVFYQERPKPMARLQQAYENWKHGRYASTILIGQRGCGITTLIRFFLDDLTRQEKREIVIIQANTTESIYTERVFLDFLGELLTPESPFEDLDAVVAHFCESESKHIVIVEHLEHYYLKKVGGFQCLRWLMELVSRTHQQVFWLVSCTQYAWDYLDKASQVSDHFEYTIRLETAKTEVVKEIILKRHQVSGYELSYAPDESDLANKRYQKLEESEQQGYLEEEYFQDLSRITEGNFAIALLYWLRSALEVTDDHITIGSLKKLEFSFLKSLSVPQMIILHALLLHNGLTMEQFQTMSGKRMPTTEELVPASTNLQLLQLFDDGLLIKQEEEYHIHPLLYRQVVELLQTRNFVH